MMRLWNRKPEVNANAANGVAASPNAQTPKRRLRESNSIEDPKDPIKSPKPSAKSKKMDEHPRKFSQLVQNHENRNESRKGNFKDI